MILNGIPLYLFLAWCLTLTDLITNIPILPSGILDFCKQKLWPLLCSQQTIWHRLAIYMSRPLGCCATPWPNYGNRAWCNPMSHSCRHCATPWPSLCICGWCNSIAWDGAIQWVIWGNTFSDLNKKKNKNTKQWKLKRPPSRRGLNTLITIWRILQRIFVCNY